MNAWGAYAAGTGLAALGFCLHSWPRRLNRYFGVDSWRNLAAADHIRRGRPLSRYHEERYLIPGASDYPPVFRHLLAVLPKGFLERYEWAVGPACDVLHSMLLFHVVWMLTHNLTTALLAQVVHITSPLVMIENASLSARPFASLLFSAAVLPLVCVPLVRPAWPLLATGLLFLTTLFLTHRLAIQAFWILTLVFTVWDRTWLWIGCYAAGTALAALISRGFYWRILRGQIAMFQYWRRHLPHRYAHQVRGMPSGASATEPDALTRLNQWIVRRGAFAAVLGANPATLVIPLAAGWAARAAQPAFGGIATGLLERLVVWGVALLVAGLLIRQVPAFRIIGDGERYLDSAVLPTAIVVAALWSDAWAGPTPAWVARLIGGVMASSLAIACYLQYAVVVRDVKCSIRPALWRMLDYLKTSLPADATLATIPLHLVPTLEYFTPFRVLSTDSGVAHLTDLTHIFPVIRQPVPELLAGYGVQYLLLNEAYARLEEVGFSRSAIVHQDEEIALIRVAHQPAAALAPHAMVHA